MQLHLANYLKTTGHYDSVDLEYYIPRSVLVTGLVNPQVDCPWGSDLYLDLVVSKDGEYAPIELKYKTKEIITSYSRFGNVLSNVNVVKNQSAQDLGRYDFGKDVRRTELIKQRFNNTVKNGFSIFLTNDKSYQNTPKLGANYTNFSMNNGIHGTNMAWLHSNGTTKGHPNFTLNNQYTIDWKQIPKNLQNGSQYKFYYTIVSI